ncbi:DNA adenine methylase [Erwinia tracheiphila]|uniref:site-specific DNA-methyltransferase (adenine-specific) n=1 Tax=Erwinia tracheiphila TaxID=65700 RepID=A0A0M2KK76_9GAMM|nr:DNA adenine methylase [Erwinia tracheiphila]EOS93066.1 D12 class N6 adenine-specific DNA methyltransferase [Erwinia tracheiphila PSU-1]KKF37633.1 modification methylase [Erwinia tracheiphila]UIA89030.1 DNA adenine methylase [Erwinia tracheiphila]UIA97413.1 DNA adenine methylase [Erwinia tracheiphila]
MVTTVIPWVGGKRKLAKSLLPLFPAHTCYVEPFCGGAALFFMKEPSKAEVLNDINSDIVNLYRVIQNHLEEFIKQFKWALTSREIFQWLKDTPPETLTDIQRAARFYYLQKLSFGAKAEGRTFGTSATGPSKLNLLRLGETLSEAWLRLHRVTIEHLDWKTCITRYDRPDTLFYLDPPYWQTQGYGVPFGLEEYAAMAELARRCQGRMIISVNDHPDMRRVFEGLEMMTVNTTYSVGSNNGHKAFELVICNFSLEIDASRL